MTRSDAQNELNPANRLHAWAYVVAQGILLGLLIFSPSKPGIHLNRLVLLGNLFEGIGLLGILLSAASLRRTLTAIPLPKIDGKLSTNGLYRFVRHPMYTSVLFVALGISLLSGSVIKYLLSLLLAVLFYFKSIYEEKYLTKKYAGYESYARRTPRFMPFTKWKS